MKIFISWSGKRSRAVAEALNDWLKRVIQAVKPFYSPDIEKGAKWSNEIDNALEGTKFGIICLTPDNLHSTWVHYEAGALSKTPDAMIWTFLHGLDYGDVPPPLGKFQHTVAEKDDVLKLLKSINARLSDVGFEPLGEQFLEENFNLFWDLFEQRLKESEKLSDDALGKSNEEPTVHRGEREMLSDVLELMREQQRRLERIEDSIGFSAVEHYAPINFRNKTARISLVKRLYITYANDVNDDAKTVTESYLKSLFGACQIVFIVLASVNTIIVTFTIETPISDSFLDDLSENLSEQGLGRVRITYN
jgi:hypothetical protein